MKKFTFSILSLLLLGGSVQNAFAQAAPGTGGRYFSLGPVFMGGASTFAGDVEEGYKIKPRFSLQFGMLSEVDISEAIAFNLGLTYETRARYMYLEEDEDLMNTTTELAYFTISPLFNFRKFLLGFGLRLPMSGNAIVETPVGSSNNDIDTDDMKMAIELKIGGNIEILETRGGALNFIVLAGYDLVPPFKSVSTGFDPGQPDASLHIGLNYLFNAAELK
jgi:hypothetical protein